ncbi:MAG TPA: YfhO family protein [Anaeromyxobacteraceae bacterium]|nr:YfhO family protein [Anaeromyxobacteraceae bacterium]
MSRSALRTASRWAAFLALPAAVVIFHARAASPGQAFVGYDLRNYFFAVREATASALRAGHLPGWQRGIFLGYPLLADPQAAVLDPASWLTLPWGAPRALTIGALIHLCVAGWGMIYWLRLRGLSATESLLGALLFSLGAKETVHLQHWNFAASTAWWPWMLAGLEGFAARGRGRFVLLTAFASAFSWLGGAAQMAYFGTLVACAYALVLAPRAWRRRPLDAALVLAAAPLGFALAAPIMLPVSELAWLGPRGAGVAYRFATSWKWPDRWGLALFLLPRAYGGQWQCSEMNLWEATGYLGILPLGLAAAFPRRRGLWLFVVLGILGVWLSFGEGAWLGLHRAFYRYLPGYGSFRNPTRALMVTSFSSALVAAEGLSALRQGTRACFLRAALVLLLIIVIVPVLPRFPSFSLDRAAGRQGAVTTLWLALLSLVWLCSGVRLTARWRALWALAPCALVVADLHLAFGDMNPVASAAGETPPLADMERLFALSHGPQRMAVIAKWGSTANAALRLGWENATGYGPTVIQRVRSLLEATQTDRVVPPTAVEEDTNFPRPRPTSPLWPLLAAPLVVSDEPLSLPRLAEIRPEFDRPTAAYRAAALPRVFWTGGIVRAPDTDVAAPMLAAASGTLALLADDGSLDSFPASGEPSGPIAADSVVLHGDRVEASLTVPRAGLAVVLEPWFPGWTATVDGSPVLIARADFAFMAVPVPAGRHALRLSYSPTQLARGTWLASGALALLSSVLALRRRASPLARR